MEHFESDLLNGGETARSYSKTGDLVPNLKVTCYTKMVKVNPLNAELNPICHLLVLLGDLTFMVPCIVSIFQNISNKMQRYTVYLYLETALHVSGGNSTHHQVRKQLYLQHYSGRWQ